MQDWKDPVIQLKVLESRARRAVFKLATMIQKGTPWKDLNMDCVSVSRAHIEVFILRTFLVTITSNTLLSVPLTKLFTLVRSPHLSHRLILVRSSYALTCNR